MGVMMVMGAAPDTGRAQNEDSKDSHKSLGQLRMQQYRAVLLIVVDHEEPQKKKARETTACNPCRRMNVPDRPYHGGYEQERRGNKMPPASGSEVRGVRFCCQDDIFACPHAMLGVAHDGNSC
jgi:hypothetical protein